MDLQKKNGHEVACGIMANTLRDDLKKIVSKTGFEKEVYGKVVVRGEPVELLLKCNHMNDFEGTADDLKRAIDTLMEGYGINTMYESRLVSVCAVCFLLFSFFLLFLSVLMAQVSILENITELPPR